MCNKQCEVNVDSTIRSFLTNIDVRLKAILCSACIWGLFAHGMALFNKYSLHDDILNSFKVGTTYSLGRWFLNVLHHIMLAIFQCHYSTPLTHVSISILLIAMSSYCIVCMLRIRNLITCALITGIMVTYPPVSNLFGYMFTAPYYMFALLLASTGVQLLNRTYSVYNFICGTILICCSIGIYQAFIPYTLGLFVLCFVKDILYEQQDPQKLLLTGIYFVSAIIVSVGLYFICTYISLHIAHTELSSYQNVNSMGQMGLLVYVNRMITAYKAVWHPNLHQIMYPMSTYHLYRISVLLSAILLIQHCLLLLKAHKYSLFGLLTLAIISIPVAYNFIYIMCHKETVHSLMVYGGIFPFLLCMLLAENKNFSTEKLNTACYGIIAVLIGIVSLIYCRFDNVVYMKAEFIKQQMISYHTTLITHIKSCKGYKSEYPVVFIGSRPSVDKSITNISQLSFYTMPWINLSDNINTKYAGPEFMAMWCGYSPVYAKAADFENLPEVKAMPEYPENGSIKVINNAVIIKLQ